LQLAHIATLPQTAGVWFKGPVQKKKHGRRQNGIQHHKIINLPQDSATRLKYLFQQIRDLEYPCAQTHTHTQVLAAV
jgi:hypothetical protein